MNRPSAPFPTIALILACLAALLLACFHRTFLNDHQFAYRDAAHYYYPLYERVQREWNEGRWPLWEPEENSGMPLMGNPTAAVLYPGKIVYGLLPYAWAARVYIIGHVALAFAAMLALSRSWGISWIGSGLSALSFAFSGPILFQYCNVIYLVGAAWLPLGFLAVDRWVRRGSRMALAGLAAVLAMQTLGGDPQASYLLGLCALGYAAVSTWTKGRGFREGPNAGAIGWKPVALAVLGVIAWSVAALGVAAVAPSLRPAHPSDQPTPAIPWTLWAPRVVPIVWAVGLAFYFGRRKPTEGRRTLWRLSFGLGASAALAAAIAAAQLLPVIEFTQQTSRAAADGPHEIYPFSVEPFRVVETFWPNVFGAYFHGNASWVDLIQLGEEPAKVWTPSLYVGAAIVLLALPALGFRRGGATRVWLSWIVAITLLGSFGQFTSPIWATRFAAKTLHLEAPAIGPLDPPREPPLRKDGHVRDGDGGLYWAMTTFLPAFRQFRFPSKLMTFSVLGLAALAGLGWDDLTRGRSGAARKLAIGLLAVSIVAFVAAFLGLDALFKSVDPKSLATAFGPFDPTAARRETLWGLAQAATVAAAVIVIAGLAASRPAAAGAAILALTTADLALANRGMIATVPQALFEAEPEVIKVIREAEAEKPADGPYRIHRSPIWNPIAWKSTTSRDRVRDFMQWERDTIQPKYGVNLGVEYTHTLGVAELYDYEWFFGGFPFSTSPEYAAVLKIKPGDKVVYFPRKSFDMWNTRYFVLPSYANDWMDENRGIAGFLFDTEIVHPVWDVPETPEGVARAQEWVQTRDYQVRRNLREYPRAWVVHAAETLPPIAGLSRADRAGPMQDVMYDDQDPIWRDRNRVARDLRQIAWVEADDATALAPHARRATRAAEKVAVAYPRPDRVVLDATLETPGIVVLADVFYPGWKLSIDGRPAPIYRVNRMMRGAAVEAGKHTLIYSYEPDSFRIGLIVSAVGLAATLGLAGFALRRPRSPLPWVDPDRGV